MRNIIKKTLGFPKKLSFAENIKILNCWINLDRDFFYSMVY